MNFFGTITIERQVFSPSKTVLEWRGPSNLTLSETVLTDELGDKIESFLQAVETKFTEEYKKRRATSCPF